MSTRLYLDFDGVINILNPGPPHGKTRQLAGDVIISEDQITELADFSSNPEYEIIWASHREEEVYFYTDQLGLPRYPHLVFTDPTGSKVKDIIIHYQADPCDNAAVWEDSLTSAEIKELNKVGIGVIECHNAIVVGAHPAGGES